MSTPSIPTTSRASRAPARWLCLLVAIALAALLAGATVAATSRGGAHPSAKVAAATVLAPANNPGRVAPPGFVAAPAPPAPTPNPGPTPAPTQTPAPAPAPAQVEEPGWLQQKVAELLDGFFRTLVTDALNPVLGLMGAAVLSSPTPEQLPRLTELWEVTRGIAVSLYVLLVLAACLIAGAYQTVQTRYSVGALLPRLVIGFFLINASLWVVGQATVAANALTRALLGDGVDPQRAAVGVRQLVSTGASTGAGLWVVLVLAALLVLVIALVIGWAVRITLLAAMIVAAPLALACHGLPHTERLAAWWWRVVGALLAAQVGQALTLAVALRVLLDPGGAPTLGAATSTGNQTIMNLFLVIAVVGVMVKIPIWALGAARLGQGSSLLRSVVRTWLAYKSLGLLARGGSVAATAGTRRRLGRGLGGGLVRRRPHASGRPAGNRGGGRVGGLDRARPSWPRRAPSQQSKPSGGFAGRFRSRMDTDRAQSSRSTPRPTPRQRIGEGIAGMFGARVVRPPTKQPPRRPQPAPTEHTPAPPASGVAGGGHGARRNEPPPGRRPAPAPGTKRAGTGQGKTPSPTASPRSQDHRAASPGPRSDAARQAQPRWMTPRRRA